MKIVPILVIIIIIYVAYVAIVTTFYLFLSLSIQGGYCWYDSIEKRLKDDCEIAFDYGINYDTNGDMDSYRCFYENNTCYCEYWHNWTKVDIIDVWGDYKA